MWVVNCDIALQELNLFLFFISILKCTAANCAVDCSASRCARLLPICETHMLPHHDTTPPPLVKLVLDGSCPQNWSAYSLTK